LSLQIGNEAVKRARDPIGYMVVGTGKQRDAHSPNLHIIRLVTYRGRPFRDLDSPRRLKGS
jgi:hypothetical protein